MSTEPEKPEDFAALYRRSPHASCRGRRGNAVAIWADRKRLREIPQISFAPEALPPHLFMSGYSRNAVVHQGRIGLDIELIQKPISLQELTFRIRDALDRKPME